MNREIARENLSLLKSILDKHGITFWLAWGTCLVVAGANYTDFWHNCILR